MNSKISKTLVIGIMTMMIAAIPMMMFSDHSSAAEPPEDFVDTGDYWSYTLIATYAPPTGSDPASYILWDFGDGTPEISASPMESVRHVYSSAGIYYVKQTAVNLVGSNSAYYQVNMRGFPTVTYHFGQGLDDVVVQQTAYNVSAGSVTVPAVDGYRFGGWYFDEDLSDAYQFAGITEPVTLYARWIPVSPTPGGDDSGDEDEEQIEESDALSWLRSHTDELRGSIGEDHVAVFAGIATAMGLIAAFFTYRGRYLIVVIAATGCVICALLAMGAI